MTAAGNEPTIQRNAVKDGDGSMSIPELWEGLKMIPGFRMSLRRPKVGRRFRTQTLAHVFYKYGVWSLALPSGTFLTLIAPFAFIGIFAACSAIDYFGSRILDRIFLPANKRWYTVIERNKKDSKLLIRYDGGAEEWIDG